MILQITTTMPVDSLVCIGGAPQERKKVAAEGIRVRALRGGDIKSEHWDSFYKFYLNTVGTQPWTCYVASV